MGEFTAVARYDPIRTMATITDEVIVAFSGGKDSIVTLDLAMRYFKKVHVFFMYLHSDLSFQQKLMRWYEKKYNIEIMQLPHFQLGEFFRYGIYRPFPDFDFPLVGLNDVYRYVRNKTGAYWIMAGERISDSLTRRAMIKHSGTIDTKRGRFYPIANFSKNDVLEYIKGHKLYISADTRQRERSFSNLYGDTSIWLRDNFPQDYKKMLSLFPFAGASIKRYEVYGKK